MARTAAATYNLRISKTNLWILTLGFGTLRKNYDERQGQKEYYIVRVLNG